jgi:hypothetical protein
MHAAGSAVAALHPKNTVYAETWAVLEMHFLTRPHLMAEARAELARVFDRLIADGHTEPHVLKDLACRMVQLMYGPAPARETSQRRTIGSRAQDRRPRAAHRHAPSPALLASAR